ncbi:hypothetical protein HDU76_011791, partial [Blyttiomyces sp. JEL0837]
SYLLQHLNGDGNGGESGVNNTPRGTRRVKSVSVSYPLNSGGGVRGDGGSWWHSGLVESSSAITLHEDEFQCDGDDDDDEDVSCGGARGLVRSHMKKGWLKDCLEDDRVSVNSTGTLEILDPKRSHWPV